MSNNLSMEKIWLIGAGGMAEDYAKVLTAQSIPFSCIGRGKASAAAFTDKTGVSVITGGVELALKQTVPDKAIVSVGVPDLAETTRILLAHGVRHILLEKPGGMDKSEIAGIADAAKMINAEIHIAYNRRFHASTLAAEEIIKNDGGITSFNFEFTEWMHVFRAMERKGVDVNIFFSNSTHPMDLAYYLGGYPETMSCYVKSIGYLWDTDSVRIYTGAGISSKGALFSYQANWNAPGRWGVEILTTKSRLIFRPLEQLHIQKIGSVAIEKAEIDDSLDLEFKPGLYREVEAFITGKGLSRLPDIHEQLAHCKIYEQMQKVN